MPEPFVSGYWTISMLASLGNAFVWLIFSVTTLCKYKKYEMYDKMDSEFCIKNLNIIRNWNRQKMGQREGCTN